MNCSFFLSLRIGVSQNIRLEGGATLLDGRVELLFGGVWAAVCDENWTLLDGNVACRQLGLGVAINVGVLVIRISGSLLPSVLVCSIAVCAQL